MKIKKHPFPLLDKEGKQIFGVDTTAIKVAEKRIKELKAVLKENKEDLDLLEKRKSDLTEIHYKELHDYYLDREELANNEIKKQEEKIESLKVQTVPLI